MAQPELLEIARVRADQVKLLKKYVDRGASSRERLRDKIDDLKAQLVVARAAAAAAAAAAPDDESRELLESYAAVEEARLFPPLFLFHRTIRHIFFSERCPPPINRSALELCDDAGIANPVAALLEALESERLPVTHIYMETILVSCYNIMQAKFNSLW